MHIAAVLLAAGLAFRTSGFFVKLGASETLSGATLNDGINLYYEDLGSGTPIVSLTGPMPLFFCRRACGIRQLERI